MKPDQMQIDSVLNELIEQIDEGGSRFPGQSYEEGVKAGIEWAAGMSDEEPYPDS